MPQPTATIVGAGAMGMATAVILLEQDFKLTFWDIDKKVVDAIATQAQNPRNFPEIRMPKHTRALSDISEAVFGADLVVFSVASPYLREVAMPARQALSRNVAIISVAKGLEQNSLKTMVDVLEESLGGNHHEHIMAFSGPTLADEIARKMPFAAMIASKRDNSYSQRGIRAFSNSWSKIYETRDVLGVEIAGVAKHLTAIMAGVVQGLDWGDNTRAWILSEAFRDAARLIWKLGGTQETVYGLAGLGDTFASAFSPLGRNRQFGELLGQGNTIAKAQSVVKDTVEGITAVDCLHKLALREKLRLPVLQAAYDVVVGKEKAGKVFEELLKNL